MPWIWSTARKECTSFSLLRQILMNDIAEECLLRFRDGMSEIW